MSIASRFSFAVVLLCTLGLMSACQSDELGPLVVAPTAFAEGYDLDYSQRQVLDAQVSGADRNGLPLTYAVATQPQNGFVQMRPDGQFYYAPMCGFTGDTDSFTFIANNGTLDSAPATATVSVINTLDPFVRAAAITSVNMEDARIHGPLSRGGISDFVLENELVKVIIQGAGRRWGSINPHGGTVLDAVPRCSNNGVPLDHWEDHASGVNFETTYNPDPGNADSIQILNDGADGNPAVIAITGPDDLIDFINGSSAIRNLGFSFPDSADDKDLPIQITRTYTLEQGKPYVKMDLRIVPTSATPAPPIQFYLAEYLNGSGELEVFQHGYGFGEPLATTNCSGDTALVTSSAPGSMEKCLYIIYAGVDGGAGVSYGFLHRQAGSTGVSVSGVTVPVFGVEVAAAFATGAVQPNYQTSTLVPFTQTHYFAVGKGSVAHVLDQRNQIYGVQTGTLTGTVLLDGAPMEGAEVAVLGQAYGAGPQKNVVNHYRTGRDGKYTMTLGPGSYTVRANKEGYLLPAGNGVAVQVAPSQTATAANIVFTATGGLKVKITDPNGVPLPGKVTLVGFDPSPVETNFQDVAGALTNNTGVHGDASADRVVYGTTHVEFVGKTGVSPLYDIEPGNYQLVVSHGARHSVHREAITIAAGQTLEKTVRLAQVVKTPGFVSGDFHVHGINSPDSEVTHVERILTYLAEGVDFFTPSDHEMRTDLQPTLNQMQSAHLAGTAPSAEITTFDYGHFNSWPVTVHDTFGGGSVDWGGAAPVGDDFPSKGNYSLTPAQLIAAAHSDLKANVVQINHYYSHMGPDGLDIDSGVVPPQSAVPGADRRLDPAVTNYFTDTFDALEIWIGEGGRDAVYDKFLGRNAGDWFNFLNQGIVRTAVTDSDTHERRLDSLTARTYMASAVTNPALLSGHAESLAASIKAGRAIGTNGPFMTVKLTAPSTGEVATHALGNPLLVRSTDGVVDVSITIASPEWAEYDRIELYINSPTEPYDKDDDGKSNDYRIIPQVVFNQGDDFSIQTIVDVPMLPGASHFETTLTHRLTGLVEDSWIVVMVKGTDGVSKPLFPMDPHDIDQGNNTTLEDLMDGNLGQGGVTALAYSNPLFVDTNNDGDYDAPGLRFVNP